MELVDHHQRSAQFIDIQLHVAQSLGVSLGFNMDTGLSVCSDLI